MDDLVSRLSQLNSHARLDRAARQQARDKVARPKSIQKSLETVSQTKLLKLTDKVTDDDLPKLHHELAARTKGINKRQLLQQCFDITAGELDLNKLPASSTHVMDVHNWDFIGTSCDTLGSGLPPFSVVPPDTPSKPGRKAMQEEQE